MNTILEKLSIKDIVWLMTWGSLVYMIYMTLEDISQYFEAPFPFIVWLLKHMFADVIEQPEPPTEPEKVNWMNLSLAMGAAWIIMNTTTDDIKDAANLITSFIKKI